LRGGAEGGKEQGNVRANKGDALPGVGKTRDKAGDPQREISLKKGKGKT